MVPVKKLLRMPRRWMVTTIVGGSVLISEFATVGSLAFAGMDDPMWWFLSVTLAGIVPLAVAGMVARLLCALLDELAVAQRELRARADSDGLTGTLNRRRFFEVAEEALARSAAGGRALSLVLFDVDDFKRINDRHGHAAGDAVLRGLTRTCQRALRAGDPLARLGGEEFVALLEGADHDDAMRVAARLREAVAEMVVEEFPLIARTTVSVGVATRSGDEPLESLMARADAAMYEAKRAGKNQVTAAVVRAAAAG